MRLAEDVKCSACWEATQPKPRQIINLVSNQFFFYFLQILEERETLCGREITRAHQVIFFLNLTMLFHLRWGVWDMSHALCGAYFMFISWVFPSIHSPTICLKVCFSFKRSHRYGIESLTAVLQFKFLHCLSSLASDFFTHSRQERAKKVQGNHPSQPSKTHAGHSFSSLG